MRDRRREGTRQSCVARHINLIQTAVIVAAILDETLPECVELLRLAITPDAVEGPETMLRGNEDPGICPPSRIPASQRAHPCSTLRSGGSARLHFRCAVHAFFFQLLF